MIPPTDRRNHRLTHLLVSRLQPRLDPGGRDAVIAGLEPAIGARHVVGVTLRQGVVTVFVTERQPSQVELDAMLRLTLPAPQAATREDTSR